MGDVSALLERDGRVARVRIDNPPLNILTTAVREALFRCVHRLAAEDGPDVVILEGAGKRAFSVGSDIKSFPEDEVGAVNKIRFEQYLLDRITTLPQLTIAKLNGHVLGGGAELMLACDLRIAAEGTQIGFPEIKLGALPAAGGTQRLMRELGPARARELVYLGDSIDADEAYRMLRSLAEREHLVHTAFALSDSERLRSQVVTSHVWLRALGETELRHYCASATPYDKAGGYAIQDRLLQPVARIVGSYSNVMGLPLEALAMALRAFGLTIPFTSAAQNNPAAADITRSRT